MELEKNLEYENKAPRIIKLSSLGYVDFSSRFFFHLQSRNENLICMLNLASNIVSLARIPNERSRKKVYEIEDNVGWKWIVVHNQNNQVQKLIARDNEIQTLSEFSFNLGWFSLLSVFSWCTSWQHLAELEKQKESFGTRAER